MRIHSVNRLLPLLLAACLWLLPNALFAQDLSVQSEDGSLLFFSRSTGKSFDVEFNFQGKTLQFKAGEKESGKWIYEGQGASSAKKFKVKLSDNGFKLEQPDGSLLRKVKVKEDKLKISDNQENTNPFVLKRKSAEKIEVGTEFLELGKVNFQDGSLIKVKTTDETKIFQGRYSRLSNAFGVLLLDAIPLEQRAVLFAELLRQGR